MTEKLIVLGSTGSIGVQTLQVARRNNIRILALAAGRNVDVMEQQAREFLPKMVAMQNETAAQELKIRLADTDIKVYSGEQGVLETVHADADTVLNAIVGIAGLKATLETVRSGKILALANKESLVTGGELVKEALKQYGGTMLPVDSEHSAIFQSLQGVPEGALDRVLLTASGGPFFGKTKKELENVSVEQTLRHPNWSMGQKITVDSATLMNKGLEVIEAVHLFDLSPDRIDVVVQRESIIHSGVVLKDGGLMVQMGVPDMMLPIQYALTYPNRLPCSERLDLCAIGKLTFFEPDKETFPCLSICTKAITDGGLKPTAANGANEEAVALFLKGQIGFTAIARLVEGAVAQQSSGTAVSLESIFDADASARRYVRQHFSQEAV